jgi:hypothetical protein
MANMDALVEMPGKGLARPSPKGGLALINAALADVPEMMTIADRCNYLHSHTPDHSSHLGCIGEFDARFVGRAKIVLGHLCHYASACAAYDKISDILHLSSEDAVTQAMAAKMLSVLFGALSKRKADDTDENPAMLLAACADMFDPMNDFVGENLRLWKPICKHPVVLALAIKKLLATQKFSPSPSELREAIIDVQTRIGVRASWIENWLVWVDRADEIAFTFDRAAWDAAYAGAGSEIVLAVRERLGLVEGPDQDYDDDGKPLPPSPHWLALDDLYKAKLAAEEAAEAEAESKQRIAACEMKPTKRTRKPKREKEQVD